MPEPRQLFCALHIDPIEGPNILAWLGGREYFGNRYTPHQYKLTVAPKGD